MNICTICYDSFGIFDNITWLHCGHKYHSNCIKKWYYEHYGGNCPLCRKIIKDTDFDFDDDILYIGLLTFVIVSLMYFR